MKSEKFNLSKLSKIIESGQTIENFQKPNLKDNSSLQGGNSLLKPSAQTITLCEPLPHGYEHILSSIEKVRADKTLPKELIVFIVFQFEHGLRVSELINISHEDITKIGDVVLKSSKGSNNKVLNGGEFRGYFVQCKKAFKNPFNTYNRFFIYRLYKKYGISFQSEKSSKLSVTHAFRHIHAQSLREENQSNDILAEKLRHKNSNNSKIYGKQKKNSKN